MGEADPLALIGTTIAEKYAVDSLVGQGGFALVYKARHLIWRRPVAIKVFKALGDFPQRERAALLEQFIQEGALMADLSERSASIVQARDIGMLPFGEGNWVPFMVLEWLEGASLDKVLADERRRGLPLRSIGEAVKLLDPAAQALALAHSKGIAHRDVKPANIFILGDPRGEFAVKLLDFGIAKVVSDACLMARSFERTGGVSTSFTPAYAAPEQFSRSHGATGPWTDVFALALILAELVTGREALDGADVVQLAVSASRRSMRPTPRALGASVSDEVERVFQKAVSIRPADRHRTVSEFWSELRAAVEDSGSVARVPAFPAAASVPRMPNAQYDSGDLALAATALPAGQPASGAHHAALDPSELAELARTLTRERFAARFPGMYLLVNSAGTGDPLGFNTMDVAGLAARSRRSFDMIAPIAKAPGNPYPDRISIGRARNCDVVIRSPSVSKLHAHLHVEGNRLSLVDVGSHNGTRLNGRPLKPQVRQRVGIGDALEFGMIGAVIADGAFLFEAMRDD